MFVDVRIHGPAAALLRVVDSDTGKEISEVVWANDQNNEFGRYKKDATGKHVFTKRGASIEVETVQHDIRLEVRP